MDITEDRDAIRGLLMSVRRIAVVGASPKPERDSHSVFAYLRKAGYDAIPVNPGQDEILGVRCYADLPSIPGGVDLVDVFRSPEHVPGVVDEAIAIGAKAIWLQLGVVHPEAAKRASDAGLTVVMDRCIRTVHSLLRLAPR